MPMISLPILLATFITHIPNTKMADEEDQNDSYDYEEKVSFCDLFRKVLIGCHDFTLFVQIKYVNVIAKPLAPKKSTKKLHKLVKKASQSKFVRRGVKEVVKALRKGEKGFCIIAGDISPIDVVSHLPVMCEDRQIPYLYVPSKIDLGAAACTKRPTSCVLINPKDSFSEMSLYTKLMKEAKESAMFKN
jgi:H/ACA ribonucleoprotein complex subunit 2